MSTIFDRQMELEQPIPSHFNPKILPQRQNLIELFKTYSVQTIILIFAFFSKRRKYQVTKLSVENRRNFYLFRKFQFMFAWIFFISTLDAVTIGQNDNWS
jgi:hypothetical protein